MKLWPLGLFSSALLAGCETAPATRPTPPLDAAAPPRTETATFALG